MKFKSFYHFRYDDVCKSYSRSVKKLCKKNKQLKKLLQEAEFQRFINIQLHDTNILLHQKIEQICLRYLHLLDKRNDEVLNYHADHITR